MSSGPTRTWRRAAEERGRADHGWLQARFTFSFADYFDPDHMGFKSLRVMNNDTIQPGRGFPMHAHKEMEIFTYVVSGQLEHRDSLGNGALIEAGNLQYMSAGQGVRHSEVNPSPTDPTVLYQVWLTPHTVGGEPRYAQVPLAENAQPNQLVLLFAGDGRDGATAIRQQAEIFFGRLGAARTATIPASRATPHVWIQVIDGAVSAQGSDLSTGDGLAVENAPEAFPVTASQDSQLLVFRLA